MPVGAPPAPPLAYAKGGAVYLETYGCQMNTTDSEVVLAILQQRGYHRTEQLQVQPLSALTSPPEVSSS
jgi:hypothetical protein